MKSLIFLAFFFLALGADASDDTTVTTIWPPIPKGEISSLVKRAMSEAQRGKDELAAEVSRRSDEALPFLTPYSYSNNDEVRSAVWRIASASHSPRALQLLSNVMYRPNDASGIAGLVLEDLAWNYSQREISLWGGAALQEGLTNLEQASASARTLLLLSAFKNEKNVAFLKRLRQQARPGETILIQEYGPSASLNFVIDIALAEAGEQSALSRLRYQMAKNRAEDRVNLCHALLFLENKAILRLFPDLLRDKRVGKERIMYVMMSSGGCIPKKLPSLRVCDVAAEAMRFKIENQRQEDLYEGKILSASDLWRVRQRFSHWLRQ